MLCILWGGRGGIDQMALGRPGKILNGFPWTYARISQRGTLVMGPGQEGGQDLYVCY